MQLVSIIAVCYNQAEYIVDTLDSIKEQSYPCIQLIIADDGSTDGSKEIIKEWIKKNNPATVFIDHQKNIGLTKNINSALPYINGAYYQVFGCDDIMYPEKIELQVKLLEENQNFDITYSDMHIIDAKNNTKDKTYYSMHNYKKPKSGFIYAEIIERSLISAPAVLIRISVLKNLKCYNESLQAEDYDFFLRASKKHLFLYTPNITVKYRILEKSMSNNIVPIINYKERFALYYQNIDDEKQYRILFKNKLLFCVKTLYSLKYNLTVFLSFKAFIKTGDTRLLKYTVAGIPLLFNGKKV